jgi:MOSC domain-containing protein YiiM
MSGTARVVAIQIGPQVGEPTVSLAEVVAVAGKGLEGDRYFKKVGTYAKAGKLGAGKEITLVEEEALEAVLREHELVVTFAETRRNILVRGVGLNDLVGREFTVGEVLLRGVRLCEPCTKLSARAKKPLIRTLVHRGGLNAVIVRGGTIRVGAEVGCELSLFPEPKQSPPR